MALMEIVVQMKAKHVNNNTHGLLDQLGLEAKIRGDGVS